jgi:hypothetical protein
MIILGLNAFHGDSAAAFVRDGKLVAAAESPWKALSPRMFIPGLRS